jgi:hypothetical protein
MLRRTVFVTGFPNDVKERELNNMLRFMPGYEASQMNWKNGQVSYLSMMSCQLQSCPAGCPSLCFLLCGWALIMCRRRLFYTVQAQGFALFYTGVAARAACSALGGMR